MRSRKVLIVSLLIVSLAVYIGAIAVYVIATQGAELDESKLPIRASAVTITDAMGDRLKNDNYVALSDIPDHLKNAFIAMEDKRFYKHHGIDPIRILGATVANLKNGSAAQGGSTITCQLVKNTHLNQEKTLKRKLREAKIALQVEKNYSKDEILEMYLNVLYFGNGIYGIGNACRRVFGKSPSEISVAEAASLAATIASPARYSPMLDTVANKERSALVLSKMLSVGVISNDTYVEAKSCDITINYGEFHNNSTNFDVNFILNEAASLLGRTPKELRSSRLTIETYLLPEAQEYAGSALASFPAEDTDRKLLIADNTTGGIIAYVGNASPFSAPRQQGSTLKPFIYAAASETGRLTTETPLYDSPCTFNGYAPQNYRGVYRGWMSAKSALANSSNVIAVKVLNETGIDACRKYMQKCGITLDEADNHLALALGGTTHGSTASALCGAYMTLANQGVSRDITFIKRIIDPSGKVLYRHSPQIKRAVSPSSAYIVTEMLQETVNSGTASQLSYLNIPLAAKTGTVAREDGNSDAWTIGYTSEHTFLCWYGAKDGKTMPNSVTGGNLPAKTLRSALGRLYEKEKPNNFNVPSEIRYVAINADIKDSFHALVPASLFEVGAKETIPITPKFTFDSLNKGDFYLKNLSFTTRGKLLHVQFERVPGVEYSVYADGAPCAEEDSAFVTLRKTNAFVKIDIVCKYNKDTVFRQSKLVIPY